MKSQSKKKYISPRRRLVKKLDDLWREAVKRRDLYTCQKCRSKNIIQAHHIIKRRKTVLRWDLGNGITLCKVCHFKGEKLDFMEFAYFIYSWLGNGDTNLGKEIYNEMKLKSNVEINKMLLEEMESQKRILQTVIEYY